MAEVKPPAGGESFLASIGEEKAIPILKPAKPPPPPNPIWMYMGFGKNFRPKIPSRNWLIFLSLTGSITTAIVYDKREKTRAQRKWCKLVEHIAKEPLESKAMPRRLTVFLEGPPTDGLRNAQDHFKEYVKPILVASGLDWEFIQGRKEGDVRAELAERIRNSRLPPDQRTEQDPIATMRFASEIKEFEGPRGDIVLGRHTWKEYVRGIHEGWLGPLTAPPASVVETLSPAEGAPLETLPGIKIDPSTIREINGDTPASPTESTADKDKPKKPPQPAPFISTAAYSSAIPPTPLPEVFDPSSPISFPHILGFLNTPKRMYRFFNRRKLADSIGRETAAIIIASARPYHTYSSSSLPTESGSTFDSPSDFSFSEVEAEAPSVPQTAEQQMALREEEADWHKSVRVRKEEEPERTWLDPVVLDPRIAERMRRFVLSAEDEERSRTIVVPEEEIEGWIKGGIRKLGRSGKEYFFGERKKTAAEIIAEEEDLP
ncbi:putative mitochondrial import inner membrane translocase subunit tim54 [Calycina marina]|uniref:Mitochondrial import inner membrane translocase subunit TIM54 n=1 Tax=Calycina marina TaxID=1763456 RepID=A0A9P7Z436_9HELO|nr:putative mitochondrial import inner membrane translocase subunit tim54 [Calycina marina]